MANVAQQHRSLQGIILAMSWIPCVLMLLATALMQLYPLDEIRMVKIEDDLKARRGEIESPTHSPTYDPTPAAQESR